MSLPSVEIHVGSVICEDSFNCVGACEMLLKVDKICDT